MGTNYYLHPKPACPHCLRPYEPLHIGKSSGGWCFIVHILPDEGILTLDDWRRLWNETGAYIEDEYGDLISREKMEGIITKRGLANYNWDDSRKWQGYNSEGDFHRRNSSMRGPLGLLRHQIGRHCAGHGEGTWDYMLGEFS